MKFLIPLLLVAVAARSFAAEERLPVVPVSGVGLGTNQMKIGDTAVDTTVVDGKLVGRRYIVRSNTLIMVEVQATVLPEPSDLPGGDPSTKDDSKPVLQLLLGHGDGPSGKVKGLHGLMCMAGDWRTPGLARTNRVDIYSTTNNTRIVVMVRDNGPIYSSTNSGMTWTVINLPGTYQFPLTSGPDGGGFYAEATLHPLPEHQEAPKSPALSWYAVGSAADGSKLVLTGNSSEPAPALSIVRGNAGLVISWPAAFRSFVLQANSDWSTTNWLDVTNPISITGGENRVFISLPASNTLYRLRTQ